MGLVGCGCGSCEWLCKKKGVCHIKFRTCISIRDIFDLLHDYLANTHLRRLNKTPVTYYRVVLHLHFHTSQFSACRNWETEAKGTVCTAVANSFLF